MSLKRHDGLLPYLYKGSGFYHDLLKSGMRRVSVFDKQYFFDILSAMFAYPLISKRYNIFIKNFF